MDNDNPLLQKAADLYRGLRFTMKYRGVDILPAAAGNDLARDLLESGQPFLFGRCVKAGSYPRPDPSVRPGAEPPRRRAPARISGDRAAAGRPSVSEILCLDDSSCVV